MRIIKNNLLILIKNGEIEYWQAMKAAMPRYSIGKYLNSLDLEQNFKGEIIQKPEIEYIKHYG